MEISVDQIKELRAETGLGVHDVKSALEEAAGDKTKALALLKERGLAKVAKRSERETSQGVIEVYAHGGRIGAMVEVNCETDFVGRNEDFKIFAHDLALQVASMAPESVEDLLKQEFFKDNSKTIQDLLTEVISKTGENVRISRIARFELGA